MASGNKTIAKNTIFLSIRMIFVLFVSLYTSRVFLRVLGVEDFGINNVVAGFVSMFSFLNTSLANGIQRFYNSELSISGEEGVTRVFNSALHIQGLIALIVALLLESFGNWYMYNEMVIPADRFATAMWIFQFSVVSAVLVIMQTPYSAAVMAYEKMNYFAFVGIVDVVLKLLLALALPYASGDKLWLYGLGNLVIVISSFVMYYTYSKLHFQTLQIKQCIQRGLLKRMITFSGWNFFGTFACMMREQGLNMVLNQFFGPIVNAAWGIAYQVSSALQGFVHTTSTASKPQMVSYYTVGDGSRTIGLMYTMSKLSFFILYMMAIPLCLEIDYILQLWLGDVVPEHTANFVIWVILVNFVNNLNAPLSNVVYATGQMRNYQVTFSLINLLIIPLSYVALQTGCPPETVFVTYFVMSILVQIGCLIVIRKIINLSLRQYVSKLILPILVFAVILTPIAYCIGLVSINIILRLLLEVFLLTSVGTGLFYVVVLNCDERKALNKMYVRNKINV